MEQAEIATANPNVTTLPASHAESSSLSALAQLTAGSILSTTPVSSILEQLSSQASLPQRTPRQCPALQDRIQREVEWQLTEQHLSRLETGLRAGLLAATTSSPANHPPPHTAEHTDQTVRASAQPPDTSRDSGRGESVTPEMDTTVRPEPESNPPSSERPQAESDQAARDRASRQSRVHTVFCFYIIFLYDPYFHMQNLLYIHPLYAFHIAGW